jgi:hypothetical protein
MQIWQILVYRFGLVICGFLCFINEYFKRKARNKSFQNTVSVIRIEGRNLDKFTIRDSVCVVKYVNVLLLSVESS